MDDLGPVESLRSRAKCFAALRGRPFSLEPVSGRALNNQLWRLDTDDEVFALRVPPALDVLGIDRIAESHALQAAAGAGASPRLIDADPSGLLLLAWVDGHELDMSAFAERSKLMRAATVVRSAHVPAPAGLKPLSRVLADMLGQAVARGASIPSDVGPHLERQRISEQSASGRPRVLTHLDPWPNNFLDDGARLWLVDWEFAAATDGMSDIAVLAMSAGITPDGVRDGAAGELLEFFGFPHARQRLVAACSDVHLFEAVWGLAADAAHGSGGDFDYRAHAEWRLREL